MSTFLAAADLSAANLHTPWQWCVAILQIVLIDIVLAGDNAVVIALAVRQLDQRQRRLGIVLGASIAVLLRILLTFFTAQLLEYNYIKLAGGAAVVWIGAKLLLQNTGDKEEMQGKAATTLWSAVWLILVADLTMSIDNVLAVGGASRGNQWLIVFGLMLSIPLVVFTSNLLSKLMDRFPVIVYVGAGVLGWVGGGMIATDRLLRDWIAPTPDMVRIVEIVGVAVVMLVPVAIRRLFRPRQD